MEQSRLFASGEGGYHTYRIPAMVVTTTGSILAFCEGRKFHSHDAGKIDLLVKRSHDHGQSWEEERIAVEDGDMTCGNPCPVVDRSDGTIWLPFCKNERDDEGTDAIFQGKAERTAWITSSQDEGQTWAEPVEITAAAKDPSWTWFATGPGHGIQLNSGRIVIPCARRATQRVVVTLRRGSGADQCARRACVIRASILAACHTGEVAAALRVVRGGGVGIDGQLADGAYQRWQGVVAATRGAARLLSPSGVYGG